MAQALHERYFPRILDGVGGWLTAEIAAGRIRDLPVPPLVQQMIGPLLLHFLLKPVAALRDDASEVYETEDTIELFAQAFVRAVGHP